MAQCDRCLLLADASPGRAAWNCLYFCAVRSTGPSNGQLAHGSLLRPQIFTYEGRQICNPKFPGLRPERLSRSVLSLSSDTLALLDQADPKIVR